MGNTTDQEKVNLAENIRRVASMEDQIPDLINLMKLLHTRHTIALQSERHGPPDQKVIEAAFLSYNNEIKKVLSL